MKVEKKLGSTTYVIEQDVLNLKITRTNPKQKEPLVMWVPEALVLAYAAELLKEQRIAELRGATDLAVLGLAERGVGLWPEAKG